MDKDEFDFTTNESDFTFEEDPVEEIGEHEFEFSSSEIETETDFSFQSQSDNDLDWSEFLMEKEIGNNESTFNHNHIDNNLKPNQTILKRKKKESNCISTEELRKEIIQNIEEYIQMVLTCFMELKPPFCPLKKVSVSNKTKKVGRSINERKGCFDSFAPFLRVLSIIHSLLIHNQIITKRDLYYMDVNLFKHQRVSDYNLEKIASQLQVSRDSLNILASGKGLIAGNLHLYFENGSILDIESNPEGHIISPMWPHTITDIKTEAKFVLVVEKEAVFSKLSRDNFLLTCGPCIIITGRGFPDITTRKVIRLLSRKNLPIEILVDFDPHGISIFLAYKYGFRKNIMDRKETRVSTVKWIGIDSQHIFKVNSNNFIPLSKRDRIMAINLLLNPLILKERRIQQALQRLLLYGKKVEIEAFYSSTFGFDSNLNLLLNREPNIISSYLL